MHIYKKKKRHSPQWRWLLSCQPTGGPAAVRILDFWPGILLVYLASHIRGMQLGATSRTEHPARSRVHFTHSDRDILIRKRSAACGAMRPFSPGATSSWIAAASPLACSHPPPSPRVRVVTPIPTSRTATSSTLCPRTPDAVFTPVRGRRTGIAKKIPD